MRKLAIALCLVSSPVLACNQGDLVGRWNLFVGEYSCELVVDPNGRVNRGQCVHMAETATGAVARNPVRGRLTMQNACRITGNLNSVNREDRDIKLTIGQSRMGPNLDYWQGLAHVGVKSGSGLIGIVEPEYTSAGYETFSAVYIGD